MFTKILVSFDGSDHAKAAVRLASELALKCDATLEIVHVPETPNDIIAVGDTAVLIPVDEAEIMERAEKILAEAAAMAQQVGVEGVTTELLRGLPAQAILDHAGYLGADLIVAGRRGLGALRGLLLGSVSQKLTSQATCPVLTVPAPAKAA